MKQSIYILLVILFLGCKKSNTTQVILDTDKKEKIPLKNTFKFKKVDGKVFSQSVKKIPITPFPFSVNENLLKETTSSDGDYKDVWSLSQKDNKNLKPEDLFFTLNLLDTNKLFFEINLLKPKNEINFYLIKRFKPIKENIECLLFSSNYNLTQSVFWVLVTYNHKTMKIIDNEVVSVFEQSADEYYQSGFYINKNYDLKSSFQSHYESPNFIKERKQHILPTGKIETIYQRNFDQNTDSVFYDYTNDYKIKKQKQKLSIIEQKKAYTNFLTQISIVSLPYNSKDFYHYMQIATQERKTVLFHNKLQIPKKVSFFILKKLNQIAFKKENSGYLEGNFFYPIFKFKRNKNVTIIGYIYQSFCNYNPTIYIKLNSYNNDGEILDEFLADRRFFNGSNRFLSS